MPRFRTRRKPRRKLRSRRKKHKPKPTNQLLKKKTLVKMNYATEVSITPGAANISSHVMRANSIFDPDLTGVGHQPLTHDQYALLYDHYRVISSVCKVTPIYRANTDSIPCLWGVFVDDNPTLTYADSAALIEDKTRTTGRFSIAGGSQANSAGRIGPVMKRTFNARKLLSPEGANNALAFGTNPTTGGNFDAYFQIWAASINANTPTAAVFMVEVEYIVELTDPVVVTQS